MNPQELTNKYFPVLDYGFIALKDVMGNDHSIEEAARVSYGGGTRKLSETRGLLRYLLRHKHTTPFEMVEFKFHCAMPIFVARQWIRHRTASVNEYSGRYSLMPMIFYTPEQEQCSTQSKKNKQGRSNNVLSNDDYHSMINTSKLLRCQLQDSYLDMCDKDLTRELARIDLPLSMYTYWYWKIDLHNLLHFLKLRCDSHAQWEVRQYANIMAGIVKEICPLAFEAWEDYSFNAYNYTYLDNLLTKYYISHCVRDKEEGIDHNVIEYAKNLGMSDREIEEWRTKVVNHHIRQNFSLDMSKAKDSSYFEKIIEEHTYEK